MWGEHQYKSRAYSLLAECAERISKAKPVVTLEGGSVPVRVLRLLVVCHNQLPHWTGQLEGDIQLSCPCCVYHLWTITI